MRYELIYSARAQADLAALPDDLVDLVEERMLDLADRPASLSRPSAFPYPPNFQLYQFFLDIPHASHHFTVLFRYGTGEAALHIAAVGHIEYERP